MLWRGPHEMGINSDAFARYVLPLMNVERRDRILEVGCGEGWAARLLAAEAEEGLVIGLDLSRDAIHKARVNSTAFENILYLWAAAEEIPWQEKYFTLVLCVDSIPYLENPEKALRELYRVLIPGGSVWIVNPVAEEDESAEQAFTDSKPSGKPLSLEEWSQLLTQSGFEIELQRMIPNQDLAAQPIPHSPSGDFPDKGRAGKANALLLAARKPMRAPDAAAPANGA